MIKYKNQQKLLKIIVLKLDFAKNRQQDNDNLLENNLENNLDI